MALRADWNKESEKVQKRLEVAKLQNDEHVTYSGAGDRA